MDFLIENGAIINVETNTLSLNNFDNTINFQKPEITPQTIDNKLLKKGITNILVKENNSYLDFNTKLKKLITSNPKNSICKCEPVKIIYNKNLALHSKPYPVPPLIYKKFKDKINELLIKGIITKSTSLITSPVFTAKKSNNDIRILVDYRKVNKHIEDDNYYFPSIFDNLHMLDEMKFFTKIDLTSSFYQIPIDEDYQDITSFTCPLGQYKFRTLPFGLKSSPKLFQRVISQILNDFENIIIFVDDILIFNKTQKEHEISVLKIIKKLQNHNLEINFDKSIFMKTQIAYLGMIIDGAGFKANLENLKGSISNFIPKKKKDFQKLAGYLGFFRPFVSKISEDLIPITEAIKGKKVDIKDIIEAKNKVLTKIKENIKIVYPKRDQKFTLQTDNSNKCCSGVLTQEHGIIGIFSHKFTNTETKYT